MFFFDKFCPKVPALNKKMNVFQNALGNGFTTEYKNGHALSLESLNNMPR
jgi:hypothetical protein